MHFRFRYGLPTLLVLVLLLAGCGQGQLPATTPPETDTPGASSEEVTSTATSPPPTETPTAAESATASEPPTATSTGTAAESTQTASPVPPTERPATAVPSPAPEGKGNADVLHVRAVQASDGTWTFHVTVQHPDTGWEDYADGWDVLTPDGEVLKPDPGSPFTRLLLHPHENNVPFTRSQSGIAIPEGVTLVRVRAHDLVDGFGGREVVVDLTVPSGEDFEVETSP